MTRIAAPSRASPASRARLIRLDLPAMNRAAAGPVDRIEALLGDEVLGAPADLQPHLAVGQPERTSLSMRSTMCSISPVEAGLNSTVVQPVQNSKPEVVAHLGQDALAGVGLDLAPAAASAVGTASRCWRS
jgi:hypothetical protein